MVIAAGVVSGCAVAVPEEPTDVSASGVTLNARVSTSSGGEVTYWFRYGTSPAYGSETTHRTVEMADDSSRPVSEPIPITAGTEYHWQVCTQDEQEDPPRTNCSKDQNLYVGPTDCKPITRNTWVTANPCSSLAIGANDISVHLRGNSVGSIRNEGFDGVTIEGGVTRGVYLTDARENQIRNMRVSVEPGVISNAINVLGDSAGTVLADNTAYSDAIAMNLASDDLRVLRNTVSGYGMTITDKRAPLWVRGANNRIEGNTATLFAAEGMGRGLAEASILIWGDGAFLVGNTTNNSPLAGLVVAADDAVLIGNTANANSLGFGTYGRGIEVRSSAASLGDNTANDNDGLGIAAPAGVTDLGGNRAHGNSDPQQCSGVVCQP